LNSVGVEVLIPTWERREWEWAVSACWTGSWLGHKTATGN